MRRRGSLAISRDGRYVLTASSDKTVKLWDPKTGNNLQTYGPFETGSTA